MVLLALTACDAQAPSADAGPEPARVHPRFDLTADPMDFGAIPFPDDLYRDDDGRIALGALPSEESAFPESFPDAQREALGELEGFSTVAPAFFYFPPASIDPASLPQSPAASTREDASVFLLDVDPASPVAFRRVPVRVHWHAELGQLALRPYDGHPLVPGRRYAAVVTTSVLDDAGAPIGPHPRFAAIRDATSRPADPLDAEAYDHYGPVVASLASKGIARERIAGLAVFTVQRVARVLRDARAIVWQGDAPRARIDRVVAAGSELDALLGVPAVDAPGVDVDGGVAHTHVGWLVQGRFASPSFASPSEGTHGTFERGSNGELVVRRQDEVPFTLVLPAGDPARLPVAIFQHGLGGERSDALAVADALAEAGWAVLAIDIPFHGLRAKGSNVDRRHRFTGADAPDGFGDRVGADVQLEFLGVLEEMGEHPAFSAVYVRDVMRQSVVDLMGAVRLVREGDWSDLRASPGLESLGFSPDPIGFVGVSLGGIIGAIFVAVEPEIGGAVLAVTGGDLGRLVEHSAAFANDFLALLWPRLGLDVGALEPESYPASFHPELALYQTLLDGGDSMSFAPIAAERTVDLLFQMAENDEVVPNRATEALARAMGAQIVDAEPRHTDLARASAPVTNNVELGAGRVTRGLYRFAPATHGLLTRRAGEIRFAHPPEPPFRPIDPVPVENPIDAALAQAAHFLGSSRNDAAEIRAPAP
ncbi:MAG TPA: hypothetical protein VIL20_14230 [Sandaracinaceae bacterium]